MKYDVAIIGSALSGSIMAAILAKNGVSTLIIDRDKHPKFALGESMIPGTSHLLRIMADRYGVPELDQISTFLKLRRHVTASSGIKRNFSFVHHTRGREFDPSESTMLPLPHEPHGPEAHLFRQDVDSFLFSTAVRYGADVLQEASITDVIEHPSGMYVDTTAGRVDAKYVIDATGAGSLLARKFGLREQPTRLRTNSRCIFTHMVGVKSFDEIYGPEQHGLPQPLSEGTLHHIFDGGWLWIIPFNNYETATNPLCSVGLHLETCKYSTAGEPPEQEFQDLLSRFPEIARQFENAKPVRKWISMGRTQYSSQRVLGSRYCLLAQAAGAVDALFSRGMYITMEVINSLAGRLIAAVMESDFAPERFAPIERLTQGLLDAHDRVVHGSYIAFRDFALWNAWYRVWGLGGTLTSLRFRQAHLKYKSTGDRRFLEDLEAHRFVGTPCADLESYQTLFNDAYALMLKVESGAVDVQRAIRELYAMYDGKDWIPPMYEMPNPARRYMGRANYDSLIESTFWAYAEAPSVIREQYFDFPPLQLFRGITASKAVESDWQNAIASAADYSTFERFRARRENA